MTVPASAAGVHDCVAGVGVGGYGVPCQVSEDSVPWNSEGHSPGSPPAVRPAIFRKVRCTGGRRLTGVPSSGAQQEAGWHSQPLAFRASRCGMRAPQQRYAGQAGWMPPGSLACGSQVAGCAEAIRIRAAAAKQDIADPAAES